MTGASASSSGMFGHLGVSCLKCPISLLCVGGGVHFDQLCTTCGQFTFLSVIGNEGAWHTYAASVEWNRVIIHVPCAARMNALPDAAGPTTCPTCKRRSKVGIDAFPI